MLLERNQVKRRTTILVKQPTSKRGITVKKSLRSKKKNYTPADTSFDTSSFADKSYIKNLCHQNILFEGKRQSRWICRLAIPEECSYHYSTRSGETSTIVRPSQVMTKTLIKEVSIDYVGHPRSK